MAANFQVTEWGENFSCLAPEAKYHGLQIGFYREEFSMAEMNIKPTQDNAEATMPSHGMGEVVRALAGTALTEDQKDQIVKSLGDGVSAAEILTRHGDVLAALRVPPTKRTAA